ncbi:hypothetical protein [Abyssalbus ytuae]|uniref:Uncharacterized protein n=1 Tax=Abyssalbus ytuae TaxID=2926907 RepID=A0A9E7CSU1_9FLAO|nr:hypothetical protein [Abyssalbus ytuae]UOB16826.1 hypothetical protein MQE35_13910 [Abyssalbus ytuae]
MKTYVAGIPGFQISRKLLSAAFLSFCLPDKIILAEKQKTFLLKKEENTYI